MNIPGTYRHFKGNNYEAIGEAIDAHTQSKYVLYRQLYAPFSFWIRPLDSFLGYKQSGSTQIQRFTRIADSQPDRLKDADLTKIQITHSETEEQYQIINPPTNIAKDEIYTVKKIPL